MVVMSAPGRTRGWVKWAAALGVMLCWTMIAVAQAPKAGSEAASDGQPKAAPPAGKADAPAAMPDGVGEAAKDGDDEANAAAGAVDTAHAQRSQLEDRYKDPRAEAALANSFPELYTNARQGGTAEDRRIAAMASKQQSPDAKLIPEYVKYQVAQLTTRRNIDAMLKSEDAGTTTKAADPNATKVKAIEQAGSNLITPLNVANQNENTSFRSAFTKAIADLAPEVMKNHLFARTWLMVALSRSMDPLAAPILTAQLEDRNQPVSIKLLAAIGLGNLARSGRWADASPADAIKASRALASFLDSETDTFWPAQMRAIEAIGSLRQASPDLQQPKAEFASTALRLLANPNTNASVRAWAGWALGMIRPNAQLTNFNYRLIAQDLGLAALAIARQILDENVDLKDSNDTATYVDHVRRQADSLFQLYYAFDGDPNVRGSGIMRMDVQSAMSQRRAIEPIAEGVKAVTATAVELSQALPAQVSERRKALEAAVTALETALSKEPPTDLALIPGVPPIPLPPVPRSTKPESAAEPAATKATSGKSESAKSKVATTKATGTTKTGTGKSAAAGTAKAKP